MSDLESDTGEREALREAKCHLQRRPDVELRPGAADHLVGERRGAVVAPEVGGANALRHRFEGGLADRAPGVLARLVVGLHEQGGSGEGGRQRASDRDPLGRPRATTGPDFGNSVQVPDEIDTQRARQILEAIRKRLGNALSPELERDYLERLLQMR